jgi:hypothetical protein
VRRRCTSHSSCTRLPGASGWLARSLDAFLDRKHALRPTDSASYVASFIWLAGSARSPAACRRASPWPVSRPPLRREQHPRALGAPWTGLEASTFLASTHLKHKLCHGVVQLHLPPRLLSPLLPRLSTCTRTVTMYPASDASHSAASQQPRAGCPSACTRSASCREGPPPPQRSIVSAHSPPRMHAPPLARG